MWVMCVEKWENVQNKDKIANLERNEVRKHYEKEKKLKKLWTWKKKTRGMHERKNKMLKKSRKKSEEKIRARVGRMYSWAEIWQWKPMTSSNALLEIALLEQILKTLHGWTVLRGMTMLNQPI